MSDNVSYRTKGFFGRIPSEPHNLRERVTPTKDCIVLCHLGVIEVAQGDDWEVEVAGLVQRPGIFTVRALKEFPKTQITAIHQCAGSPLNPEKPTQRICNVTWGGVRLSEILNAVGAKDSASFIWSHGADSGEFGGVECGHYVKDMPLDRVANDVLLAYEMNGSALLPEHGFPIRLVVPGFYGTNSVKWLRRLELQGARAQSVFTTRWYNDEFPDGSSRPVWNVAPQSVIVSPSPGTLAADEKIEVWGWAWSDTDLSGVEISFDEGRSWYRCVVEEASGHAWRKFRFDWTTEVSCSSLMSRAISMNGDVQPAEGKRNAVYRVPLTII